MSRKKVDLFARLDNVNEEDFRSALIAFLSKKTAIMPEQVEVTTIGRVTHLSGKYNPTLYNAYQFEITPVGYKANDFWALPVIAVVVMADGVTIIHRSFYNGEVDTEIDFFKAPEKFDEWAIPLLSAGYWSKNK